MTDHGFTDEAFAERLGVDRSTVSRIRRGRRMPSVEIMRQVGEITEGEVMANDFVHDATAPSDPQKAEAA